MATGEVSDSITVIYQDRHVNVGAKGFSDRLAEVVQQVGQLNVTTISDNMALFCSGVAKSLQYIELPGLPYQLDAVELTVELTGSGEIRLVGSIGAELSGGIKLTFKRV